MAKRNFFIFLILALSSCSFTQTEYNTSLSELPTSQSSVSSSANEMVLRTIKPITDTWSSYEIETENNIRIVNIEAVSRNEFIARYAVNNNYSDIKYGKYNIESKEFTSFSFEPEPINSTDNSTNIVLWPDEFLVAQSNGFYTAVNITKGTVTLYSIDGVAVALSESFGGYDFSHDYIGDISSFVSAHFLTEDIVVYVTKMVPPIYTPEKFGIGILSEKKNEFIEVEAEVNLIRLPQKTIISFGSPEYSSPNNPYMKKLVTTEQ